mgnify:CR=1|jgi:hypothetical protein
MSFVRQPHKAKSFLSATSFATAMLLGSASAAQNTSCDATLSAFTALREGMSISEVERIIGCSGELLSQSEMAGFKTVMLAWSGKGSMGANMNAMFQNDAMIVKSQFGLR